MKNYKVEGGIAKFGPGQKLRLDENQIARRRHNLVLPDKYKGGPSECEALRAVEFKVGETIGLPELEKRLVDILVPQHAPNTEAEEVAVDKSNKRKAAKAAPAPASEAVKPNKEKADKDAEARERRAAASA